MLAMMHRHPDPSAVDFGSNLLIDFFDPRHRALFDPFEAPLTHRLGTSPRSWLAHAEPLSLSREDGKYVVTAGFPGVKAADISVQLLGYKVLDITVRKQDTAATRKAVPADSGSSTETVAPEDSPGLVPTQLTPDNNRTPENQAAATAQSESVVVYQRSIALPHMVDKDGVTCSYKDGLLRILVPIKPPSLPTDDQLSTRVTTLEQELHEAEARVSEFESKLAEYKTQAAAAREALRSEKRAAHHALQAHRHALTLAA